MKNPKVKIFRVNKFILWPGYTWGLGLTDYSNNFYTQLWKQFTFNEGLNCKFKIGCHSWYEEACSVYSFKTCVELSNKFIRFCNLFENNCTCVYVPFYYQHDKDCPINKHGLKRKRET